MATERPNLYLMRAADVATHSQSFSHPWNPLSELHGMHLSRAVGLKRTGVSYVRIPAGRESFAYHSHRYEEEWVYVLEGRGVALIDEVEYDVGPGDFMAFPTPSVAHLMKNPGPGDLVYLMGGETREFEISEFPRLRKRMVRSNGEVQIYDFDDAKAFAPLGD
ncbi:MAG: cupin domain-containing protein [Gammaproteobacteria bacterium]